MEKQYKPSKKRLQKARQEGNVPKSQYLSQSIGVPLGVLLCLIYLSNSWVENKILIEYLWTRGFKDPWPALELAASGCFVLIVKLLLTVSIVCIAIELAQVGIYLEPRLLALKIEKLNPVSGLAKIIGNIKQSWLVVLRFFIIFSVLSWFLYGLLDGLEGILHMPLSLQLKMFYGLLFKLTAIFGGLSVALALLDYYIQWRKWFNSAGMSLQDLKQEHKEDEGDPHIKSMRKHRHRELLQRDLIKRIRSARVIIAERAG